MEESLKQLRKPTIQVMNFISLLMVLLSTTQYFYSLTMETTPIYLIITTLIEIIVILLGLLQLFEKNTANPLKKAKRYLIVGILTSYFTYLSFYNLYFFMAEENKYDLTRFWIVGFVFLFICSCAHICSLLLMGNTPHWFKGDKTMWIIILKIIACTFYVQKIIEYIMIPNVAESHFLIILSMFMMFVSNLLVSQYYLLYGRVLTDVNKISKDKKRDKHDN